MAGRPVTAARIAGALHAERAGRRRSARLVPSPLAAAQLAPALVAAVVALRWFRPAHFVAAGDVAPYVREGLDAELGSVWNHQLTGAGSASYEIVRGIDLALIRAVEALGGGEIVAQQVLMGTCMAAAAFGSAFFARTFVSHPIAVALAGLLGAFNPFVMVLVPNPLFPLAIGLAGVLGGVLLQAARGEAGSPVVLAVATVPVAYLAVNPALLYVLVGWVAALALTARFTIERGATKRALATLLKSAPVALALSLWWVVPFAHVLSSGASGAELAAESNVAEWPGPIVTTRSRTSSP